MYTLIRLIQSNQHSCQ